MDFKEIIDKETLLEMLKAFPDTEFAQFAWLYSIGYELQPGTEVIERVKRRVRDTIDYSIKNEGPLIERELMKHDVRVKFQNGTEYFIHAPQPFTEIVWEIIYGYPIT